ncbi:TolC family protein [Marinobacter bryozoorum]|uniref:TolC family protein n=1 Tax=Marinobacter bryozoorum TaxID=256324 RepID=UPI0020044690|nr:TolC family protein [Marinobacter bryozoorum]MCK7542793.1 TolC family protein [Marinobacter bryozoorum]
MTQARQVVFILLAGAATLFSAGAQAQGTVGLEEVYRSALSQNYGLRSQQFTYKAEEEAVREAWAGVLPQVDATASYGTSEYTRDFDLQSSITDRDEHTRYDVSLDQVVYSKKTFEAIRRAYAGEKLAGAELKGRELEIGYAAVEAYLKVKSLEAEIAIIEEEQQSHQRRLSQLESMRERGFATRADTLDAQARIDEVIAELTGLQSDYRAAIKNLEAVSGLSLVNTELEPVNAEAWQKTPAVLQGPWQDLAVKNSAMLDQAEAEVEFADKTRDMESAGHWPELFVSARYTNNDTFATNLREETRVELQLRVPLYQGGAVSSRTRQAENRLEAARYEMRDTRNQVQVEVARITEDLQGSYSRIQALKAAEESANAALDAAEKGFIGGVRSLTDLLDSRNRLADIRRSITQEIFSNLVLQHELRQVAGTLSQSNLMTVD